MMMHSFASGIDSSSERTALRGRGMAGSDLVGHPLIGRRGKGHEGFPLAGYLHLCCILLTADSISLLLVFLTRTCGDSR